MERYCADGCGDASFGSGLIAAREGHITAERFEIVDSALACGPIAEDNVQDANHDIRRVSSSVAYIDIDQRNIDRSRRRVPA